MVGSEGSVLRNVPDFDPESHLNRNVLREPGPVMVWTPAQAGQMLDWLEDGEDRLYPLWS
ncbi:hypothetical protein [Nonomuraea sp. LPB2021202275-12-8]|uniref:hypothetical protein n=1 Tax=Nonomuraea sp. LPB2021202275-12-8 TaxID=3120159 RepID=UPI00300C03CA